MEITYRTNGATTTKSLTEWYFGKIFVDNMTASAVRMYETSGKNEFKFWQSGTGYMTITIY